MKKMSHLKQYEDAIVKYNKDLINALQFFLQFSLSIRKGIKTVDF
jgi:hypothetical protein